LSGRGLPAEYYFELLIIHKEPRFTNPNNNLTCLVIICLIAIAHSMWQIIKPVYVCQSVYPSVGTLTVTFLIDIH